jgi:N-acetylmuramoyl-L-alanine amidase
MSARCTESNKWGADLHVPIHTNAANKKVSGTRLFCWDTKGEGYKASKAIFAALAPITPGTSENIKADKTLYEIRVPKAPTAYIEADFHDVKDVAKWIIENVEVIGEAIAEGICDYFNVKYVKPVVEPEVLHKVQVGSFGSRANAEKLLTRLEAAGFVGYIVTEKK